MARKNLILIHRHGAGYEKDFREIAEKVHALEPGIVIFLLPAMLKKSLPERDWAYPSLTVALSSRFKFPVRRGPVLKNQQVEKLGQQEVFRKHGIPTPPALPFRFGMALDPILFGEFVVLKPMDLQQTSRGDGVHLIRRRRLLGMKHEGFPPGHPIHSARQGYLAQRFVDSGEHPSYIRVQTFLGKAIYSWQTTLIQPRCPLDAEDEELERATIATQGGAKTRRLVFDADVLALAERVHAALPHIPMLGVDIIREAGTGRLFVLECNPGGNTWHISSDIGEKIRLGLGDAEANGKERAEEIGRRIMIDQFGAFDIVARRLADATLEMAA